MTPVYCSVSDRFTRKFGTRCSEPERFRTIVVRKQKGLISDRFCQCSANMKLYAKTLEVINSGPRVDAG